METSYMKEYYQKNGDRIREHMGRKVTCEKCKKVYSYSSMSKHKPQCKVVENKQEILNKYRKIESNDNQTIIATA